MCGTRFTRADPTVLPYKSTRAILYMNFEKEGKLEGLFGEFRNCLGGRVEFSWYMKSMFVSNQMYPT